MTDDRLAAIADIRASLADGEQSEPAPRIVIDTDEHRVADEAIAALSVCPDIYQRGGMLVHVVRDESPLRGIVRGGGAPRIVALPLPRLRELLAHHARWLRILVSPSGGAMEKPAHPPDWTTRAVASRGQWSGIRPLEAVVEAPVMRPDGTVLDEPGYDAATGLLFAPATDFGRIPAQPTRADALEALDTLLDVVADFPFATPAHRAACIAGMVTPLARFAIRGPAPLFLIDANVRGSGKSLLVDVTAEITTGRPAARMAHPDGDEEMRKRVTALALAGDPLVLIDNIVGALGSASLDAALTATTWRDRVLGRSETTPDLPLLATWFATGNNVEIQADTSRRVLHVRLESDRERPEERAGFKHPSLLHHVRANRARLVRAALTILRAYVVAGRPTPLRPWGSFESWSDLVRAAVVWLDMPDPAATRQELADSADSEVNALRALLLVWPEVDPDGQGVTAAQLVAAITTPGPRYERARAAILELVPAAADKAPSARRVGNRLAHLRRRIVSGLALDRSLDRSGVAVWRVVRSEGREP